MTTAPIAMLTSSWMYSKATPVADRMLEKRSFLHFNWKITIAPRRPPKSKSSTPPPDTFGWLFFVPRAGLGHKTTSSKAPRSSFATPILVPANDEGHLLSIDTVNTKEPTKSVGSFVFMCPGRDSNPHAVTS